MTDTPDELLLPRSAYMAFVYPGVLALLLIGSDYWRRHPYWLGTTLLLLAAFSIARTFLAHVRPRQARGCIRACIYGNGLTWGVFLAATIRNFGYESWASVASLVATAGISAGSVPVHGYDLLLNRRYLGLMLAPGIFVQILMGTVESTCMAMLFAVYLAFLSFQARNEHSQRDRRADANRQLQEHAEQLEAAREVAEAANRAKSAFLANMSHELRTPLNSIIGYAEMLIEELEETGQARQVADLERIVQAGRHQLSLVSDILDYSKIEAGRTSVYRESFAVAPVVRELLTSFSLQARKNGNQLVSPTETELMALGTMVSDLTKVRQILGNLLSNACKFTKDGTIELTAEQYREEVVFSVKDTGVGISAEQAVRVFEPFTQADASTTRNYGGTGLGLTITRHYCELLGGNVRVQSLPGVGSIFTVVLPAGEAESAPAELDALAEGVWSAAHRQAATAMEGLS